MGRWGRLAVLALVAPLGGCGAKTSLKGGSRADAAAPDAVAPDAPRRDLVVDCGRAEVFTTPTRPVTVTAEAASPDPVTVQRWELLEGPDGTMVQPRPNSGAQTMLTPDRVGDYRLRFTATDGGGRTARCEVTVHAVVGPPVAICPEEELTTGRGEPVLVEGDGFDDIAVVDYRWRVASSPPGSSPMIEPAGAPVTQFVAETAGRYVLELTVTDGDMASDTCQAVVRVTAPPEVVCPAGTIEAPTRQPVPIRARVSDDTGLRSTRWSVRDRPPRSMAEPTPADRPETTLTPDRQGEYVLLFTAVDDDGLRASCEVRVIGLPTPPDAECPATIETTPLVDLPLVGDGVDDGRIVAYRWRLVSRPEGSAAEPPTPTDARRATFRPDIAGEYVVELTVTDDDGQQGSCRFTIRAVASEGLRVEMFWDTNNTDMDLHLLSPAATHWAVDPSSTDQDCHFSNCISRDLEWGAPGSDDDDPRLDLDDVDGFGPENINIDLPEIGTYRVGVYAWRGAGDVTVRVYCGGSSTEPRRTFGPVHLDGSGARDDHDFWRVADVTISATGCTVTDLAAGGAPNVTPGSDAQARR